MAHLEIAYNTDREPIRYPEYGRVIQGMLLYAKTIQERPKRQKTVEAIVQMMQMLSPVGNRSVEDHRERLWNHAFAIAGYDLDVTPPHNIVIVREDQKPKAEHVEYPATTKRFRHYGKFIQAMMEKAIEMPEGPKKEGFVEVIASYMKLAYKTWNKEHYVSDDVVKDDLEVMTEGKLELHEGHSSLDLLSISANKREKELMRQQQLQRQNKKNNGGNKKKYYFKKNRKK
jgi:hypothetical protein